MPKLQILLARAGLTAAGLFVAAPAFARWTPAPDTLVTLVPPDERLTLMGVLAHAKPLIELIFAGLAVAILYAAFTYARGLAARRGQRAQGLAFLSALAAGGPLIGLFGAAYGLVDICIGIANKRPSATLIMLAPGFAEAALCICLGLLAGAVAVIAHRHLRARLEVATAPEPAATTPSRAVPLSRAMA